MRGVSSLVVVSIPRRCNPWSCSIHEMSTISKVNMHVKAFTPLIQPHAAADINVKLRDDRHFILVPTVCILLLLSLYTNENDCNRWWLRKMPLLTYFTLHIFMLFENDWKRFRTIKVVNFCKRFKNCICNINIAVNRYSSSINRYVSGPLDVFYSPFKKYKFLRFSVRLK